MRAKVIDRDLSKHSIPDTVEDDINENPTSRDLKEDREGKGSCTSTKTALICNPYLIGIYFPTKQGRQRHSEASKVRPSA